MIWKKFKFYKSFYMYDNNALVLTWYRSKLKILFFPLAQGEGEREIWTRTPLYEAWPPVDCATPWGWMI